jgi:hypothetical protein
VPCSLAHDGGHGIVRLMREFLILAIHLLVTFVKLLRPGGVCAVAAESLLLKYQLLINNRSRQRAPNLTSLDRFLLGLTTLFLSPRRIAKLCAILKPATLFKFHKALVDRKSPGARQTLPPRLRNQWPVLADIHRSCQGQPLERRSLSAVNRSCCAVTG